MTREPIKIVRIMDRLNVGGPAVHAALTSRGLSLEATDGAFDTLLVYGTAAPGEEEMSRLLSGASFRRRCVPSLSRAISPLKDLIAFFAIFSILRRERPDVVHTHKSKAGVLGRLAAWLLRVPVRVHTFHGSVFEGYFSKRASKLIVFIERALARITHKILAISPALQKELVETHRIAPAEKVHLLPLGLDLEPLASPVETRRLQKELDLPPRTPSIGIVGRLAPIKNHSLFLRAAARVTQKRGEAFFFIVGGGECERALHEQARRLGLWERCRFTGFRSDLAEVYASLDVLALSSDNEGTPVALIEALAAGVPAVVATRVGGVADVLAQGYFGRLVEKGDEEGLARALLEALEAPLPSARRDEARAHVRAHYSIARLCADLQTLYRELAGR